MDMKALQESILKTCNANNETVLAIWKLRRFNKEFNIIEAMRVPNKSAK